MTCKVPHPSYSGLETFPTATSDSDRGPVTASLEPGHHQGAFDTDRMDVFRYFHVNSCFAIVAGKVFSNSLSEMGFVMLKGCCASLRG